MIATVKQREKIKNEHPRNTSARVFIWVTNSALKRARGLGKLRVCGQVKYTILVGYNVITHNFKICPLYGCEQLKNQVNPIQEEFMPELGLLLWWNCANKAY